MRFARGVIWWVLGATALFILVPYNLLPNAIPIVFGPLERLLGIGYAHIARFAAFLLIAVTGILTYPRHRWTIVLLMVGAAGALELLQGMVPGRTPRLDDVVAKLGGTVAGAGLATVIRSMLARVRRRGNSRARLRS